MKPALLFVLFQLLAYLQAQVVWRDTTWSFSAVSDTQTIQLNGLSDGENSTTFDILGLPDRRFEPMRYLKVQNTDSLTIFDIRIRANRTGFWKNQQEILQEAIRDVTHPQEKNLALFHFMRNHRVHWTSPVYDYLNPVLQLCAYGYGFCDDTAISMTQIAQEAGYGGAQWALTGHFTSELDMGAGLQAADADLEVLYPDYDNITPVSKAKLIQDRFLGLRIHHYGRYAPWRPSFNSRIAYMYNSSADSYQFPLEPVQNDLKLRPGESLILSWDTLQRYHHFYDTTLADHPVLRMRASVMAAATLDRPLDPTGILTFRQADLLDNVYFQESDSLHAAITAADSTRKLVLQASERIYFPLLDAGCIHHVRLATTQDSARIYWSRDSVQ